MQPNPIAQISEFGQLNQFVDTLVSEKFAGQDLPVDLRQVIIDDTLRSVTDFIQAAVVRALTPDHIEEFNALIESNPAQELVQKYIAEKIPNVTEFLAQQLAIFRTTFLNGVSAAQ